MVVVLIVFISGALFTFVFTQEFVGKQESAPEYTFYKANTLYEAGKYKEAIDEYEKLLERGFESGNLYYNLGNCYFKLSNLGRAILSYERAKRLIPRDADLEFNYNYALSLVKNYPLKIEGGWFGAKLFYRFLDYFTVSELVIVLELLYFLILFLVVIRAVYRSSMTNYILVVLLLLFAFCGGSLYSKVSRIGKEAIVVLDKVECKYEPFDNATKYFTLQNGWKVLVVEKKTGWYKIKFLDGKTGWVRKEALEII